MLIFLILLLIFIGLGVFAYYEYWEYIKRKDPSFHPFSPPKPIKCPTTNDKKIIYQGEFNIFTNERLANDFSVVCGENWITTLQATKLLDQEDKLINEIGEDITGINMFHYMGMPYTKQENDLKNKLSSNPLKNGFIGSMTADKNKYYISYVAGIDGKDMYEVKTYTDRKQLEKDIENILSNVRKNIKQHKYLVTFVSQYMDLMDNPVQSNTNTNMNLDFDVQQSPDFELVEDHDNENFGMYSSALQGWINHNAGASEETIPHLDYTHSNIIRK